jgi:WD40 repeat protein
LVDYYKLAGDEIIKSMDAIIMDDINPIFIYGTSTEDGHHGRVLLRKNWSNSPQAIDVDKGVTELKFSPKNDFVICATKNYNFYVIKQQEGLLKPESKRVISMDKELPLTINFCDQDRIAIITTEQKRHFRVNIDNPEKFEELEDKEVFNLSLASLRYHDTLNYSPVVIGQELEYIVSMRDDELEFWKNIPDLASNCGIRMNGHSSKVFGIKVSNSKDFVYSLGSTDNCLIEWHTTYELSITSDKRQLNTLGTKGESLAKANQSTASPEEAEETQKVMRECLFCQNIGEKSYGHRDSFTLFRGNSVKILNALNYKEDQKDDRSFVQRRVPEISIKLNYVYGLEAFNRRKTMFFVHYYSIGGKTQKQKEGSQQQQGPKVEQLNLPENYLREMLFSKYTPIPYDHKHQNCRRYIVYFCSRVAVVWECNTGNPKQSFYEGHRSKISCMAIHPSSRSDPQTRNGCCHC